MMLLYLTVEIFWLKNVFLNSLKNIGEASSNRYCSIGHRSCSRAKLLFCTKDVEYNRFVRTERNLLKSKDK